MVLGKRRREIREAEVLRPSAPTESGLESDNGVEAIFQRHFEARFKPLDNVRRPQQVKAVDSQPETRDDEWSEWSGISISDSEEKVEVVQCISSGEQKVQVSKEERKAFMTAKPPIHNSTKSATKISQSKNDSKHESDDDDEADNLKNDLALQRLLRESHLLDFSSSLSPTGDNRHKAIDLRLQTAGAKSSILKQEKMPMGHRKGIVARAKHVEEKRRREARENGIVLEKEKKVTTTKKSRVRDRDVGGPGVGKFKGGTLTLSKRDVTDINGSKDGPFGAHKSRRR